MTLKFNDASSNGRWRRILDTSNRGFDGGLYVNPQNDLEVYPGRGADTDFLAGDYRNIVLTVKPGATPGALSQVSAYIDGGASLGLMTSVMDISMSGILNLFLDDGSEWAPASIAALSFYDGVLSAAEIAEINGDPIPHPSAVPEPASWAMMILGFGAVGVASRRRQGARRSLA
ncbi:PEPxxWA-CTERM sorting domain-containing protein [Sphingomonas sp. XMGL2]|uniref:PEPxxWA-CTERM sorting domain-containing protein n=2 Tax=Sphingomonas quercus TaxID=2842451 RepID=A0ABS6BDI2_9SPHN|nr:PEPxxWA-CTERM sorting domain-containing protein [Sphingomonas quercus]